MSKTILAILVLGGLETIALLKGIDGQMLALAFAVIGGLGGYTLKNLLKKGKEK